MREGDKEFCEFEKIIRGMHLVKFSSITDADICKFVNEDQDLYRCYQMTSPITLLSFLGMARPNYFDGVVHTYFVQVPFPISITVCMDSARHKFALNKKGLKKLKKLDDINSIMYGKYEVFQKNEALILDAYSTIQNELGVEGILNIENNVFGFAEIDFLDNRDNKITLMNRQEKIIGIFKSLSSILKP